jgi:hypothetical protein
MRDGEIIDEFKIKDRIIINGNYKKWVFMIY